MRIGLSGSMHFAERMMDAHALLSSFGHDVFLPGRIEAFIGKDDEEKEKIKLEQKQTRDPLRAYWEIMQDADALLVLNYDKNDVPNYIGGNAFLEIGFAHVLKQKIYLLHPIPHIPLYTAEIAAMKPVILHGDLEKLRQ
jgi:hypothetical protein